EFCQTQLALLHLRSAALCFQLRLPPPRTAAEQRHFDDMFADRFATRPSGGSVAAAAARMDPNVSLLREEMSDAFEVLGRLVASVNTSVMRFGVGALSRTVRTLEAAAQNPGCQAVRAFAQHLRERGTHTEIFGESESPAFIIKEKDLDESLEEMGRRALKWACDAGERQLASARARVARSSEGLVQAEQALKQALLELNYVDDERAARVAAVVGEQSQRQLHEVDHLRRCLGQLAAASFELEHRMNSEMRSGVLQELGKLDAALLEAQSVPEQYRTAMLDAVLEESGELQRNVLRQLGESDKMPFGLQLKAKVALEERQRSPPPELDGAGGGAPATGARTSRAPQPEARGQRSEDAAYFVEALHEDIRILELAAGRVRTKHQLEFQRLRQACEDKVRGVASNLASNAEHWERVAQVRERARLIGEELALAHRQGEAATAAVESLDSHVERMAKDRDRLSQWWEGKSRAQVELEDDLARCDGRGVDLHKLQARSADASREAERLMLELATEHPPRACLARAAPAREMSAAPVAPADGPSGALAPAAAEPTAEAPAAAAAPEPTAGTGASAPSRPPKAGRGKAAKAPAARGPASAEAEPATLKPAAASREDNLTYDLRHMAAFDISPLHPKVDFLEYTRDSVQLLVNKIYALPRKQLEEGTVAELPHEELFRLPRQKPVPKQKPKTRWQQFMEERNMRKRKRSKLVFDEESGDWRPRWGYGSVKKAKEARSFIHEVKEGENPYADPFAKAAAEKKLIAAKQKLREVRNKVEAAGGKIRASVPELLKKGDPTGGSSGRGKDGLREAVRRAQVSSASKGKFDRLATGEASNLQPKKRKIEMAQKPGEEKERYLKAATRVLSSDGAVDKDKAAKVGAGGAPVARGKKGKGNKGTPGGGRRSKQGNRKPKSGRAKR
ncbi:unnamed protein product, partial [Prorocentrum cordatum]